MSVRRMLEVIKENGICHNMTNTKTFNWRRERDSPPASHACDVAHRRFTPVPGPYTRYKTTIQVILLNARALSGSNPSQDIKKAIPYWYCFLGGGERGIRTLETLSTPTRFPVVRLRPAQPSLHNKKLSYFKALIVFCPLENCNTVLIKCQAILCSKINWMIDLNIVNVEVLILFDD